MDRYHELEDLRRSLAMAPPGSLAINREDGMRLLAELQALEERLRRLRDGIEKVLAEDNSAQGR
jgi:hypothetical protein